MREVLRWAVVAALVSGCVGPPGACVGISNGEWAFCNDYNSGTCRFAHADDDGEPDEYGYAWTWEFLQGERCEDIGFPVQCDDSDTWWPDSDVCDL